MGAGGGCYAVLGIPRNASREEIRRAFRRVARTCHPDVAGADPVAAERFRQARDAYETLMDPQRRAAHDRRIDPPPWRRVQRDGAFFRSARRPGVEPPADAPDPGAPDPTDDTDDRAWWTRGRGAPPGRGPADLFRDVDHRREDGPRRPEPRRGDDVSVEVEIPAVVAEHGGTVLARYTRLRRAQRWRAADADGGLEPVEEVQRLAVAPGTRHLSLRRYAGLGDAGSHGGPPGQLVVRFRVVDDAPSDAPPDAPPEGPGEVALVDVGVVDALLGGTIEVDTPAGRVRVRVPACTSSGRRLRLRGRGALRGDGTRGDHHVEIRIVVPPSLDEGSRELVQALAHRLGARDR